MKKSILGSLLFFVVTFCFAQNVPTSESILSAAFSKAAKENKNVILMFHASWCGWCKKMDASLTDVSTTKYFSDNYVIEHLTVQESAANKNLENPGAAEYLQTLKGEKAGLPFFVILNKDGKVFADSFVEGQNLGCPASESEVQSFISMIKKTSSIDEKGLEIIAKRFKLNAPVK